VVGFGEERHHGESRKRRDALGEGVILRRDDNLYDFGGGLVYQLARGWTLRPEILYIRDESNAVGFNYSSTEAWINLRRNF
jgi:hypothetical protein